MIVGWIVLIAFIVINFFIAPNRRRMRADKWCGQAFAHRGLHGPDAPENTMLAFEKAMEAGYGIELDIRLSADGELIVMHDDSLKRMCGIEDRVSQMSAEQLSGLRICGEHGIPVFREVLAAVDGRVPLMIELKACRGHARELAAKSYELLSGYNGAFLIESFHPTCLNWYKRHAKRVIRGQLITTAENLRPACGFIASTALSLLMTNFYSRPDFIAYDISIRHFLSAACQHYIYKTPMAAWTVKDEGQLLLAGRRNNMVIFEDIRPVPEHHEDIGGEENT